MDRYLWAVGSAAVELPVGEQVADRYQVVAPQIWQDMQPELPPDFPEQLNGHILPYLRLYPHCLHVPEVYGICQLPQQRNFLSTPGQDVVILLENAPIDANGNLYPSMESMWTSATAVRQVYWLWQIWELWIPLSELGVASSLLVPNNLRVEGWRLRLRELYQDTMADTSLSSRPSNGLEDRGFDTLVSRDSPAE
ncbi:MAG: serine/threonine-protein phosphatase, partial [Moorea sp. SIO4G2]|nr:serine/threonine-protein phosphatase [Moorena sp. SIO4G2]